MIICCVQADLSSVFSNGLCISMIPSPQRHKQEKGKENFSTENQLFFFIQIEGKKN